MATQKQILANRANALHSTGPTTPEGKKIASQNSTRHGMLAQTVVLEGESKDRFEVVLNGYIALIKPRSDAETALVETMTIARWKQMRIWGIEKAGFQLEMSRESSAHGANATRGYLTFKRLADTSRVLDLTQRYDTGYERQFCRAYAFLLKLREKSEMPMDDSLPKSGRELLQFSCATATWDDNPNDDNGTEAPKPQQPEEPEQDTRPSQAPAQPISQHEPNSSPTRVLRPTKPSAGLSGALQEKHHPGQSPPAGRKA